MAPAPHRRPSRPSSGFGAPFPSFGYGLRLRELVGLNVGHVASNFGEAIPGPEAEPRGAGRAGLPLFLSSLRRSLLAQVSRKALDDCASNLPRPLLTRTRPRKASPLPHNAVEVRIVTGRLGGAQSWRLQISRSLR